MSNIRTDRRKLKELKVLELYDEGFSYRKIAKEVHLFLTRIRLKTLVFNHIEGSIASAQLQTIGYVKERSCLK